MIKALIYLAVLAIGVCFGSVMTLLVFPPESPIAEESKTVEKKVQWCPTVIRGHPFSHSIYRETDVREQGSPTLICFYYRSTQDEQKTLTKKSKQM